MVSKKVCKLDDLVEGETKVINLDNGEELALFKLEGEVYALNNLCPHKGGPLNEGMIEGNCITCPWHGWEFDIKSGLCPDHPDYPAASFPTTCSNNDVCVDLPEI